MGMRVLNSTPQVYLKKEGFAGAGNSAEQLDEQSEYTITAWHLHEPTVLKTKAYF